MADAGRTDGPGVIVVAEPAIHALLSDSGASWRVQGRLERTADLWSGLASGALDKRSRILVFSDSLGVGAEDERAERERTAAALATMAHAGAYVFVVEWRPHQRADLDRAIAAAAVAQGWDPADLRITRLDPAAGRLAVLDSLRSALTGTVTFPADLGPDSDISSSAVAPPAVTSRIDRPAVELSDLSALGALEGDDRVPSMPGPATPSSASPRSAAPITSAPRPAMPPVGAAPQDLRDTTPDYPPQASLDLLDRPRLPGQTTITVTSSKGGSGKSTASILLAATIARASAEAGAPLSVCLLDLDTRDGQVASLIGKFMPTALNIRVQPVWDEDRIRRNLVAAEGLGIDTLLAPIRPRTADTVGPDFYRVIVRSLQRMYDVVIMDTSVQYLEPLIADVAFRESDEILFVTTLASTAVQGMARALREMTAPVDESGLGVPRERIGIIVNQSVANVGMERDQVLAAGLGVPVVGVIPLATRDVLTATNLNRMSALLDHPLLGPAYNDLARACLPGRDLAAWVAQEQASPSVAETVAAEDAGRKRGLFRR